MRFLALFFVVFGWVFALPAQNSSNPFELSPRLDPAAQLEQTSAENPTSSGENPFDLQRAGRSIAPANDTTLQDTSGGNPFDLVVPTTPDDAKSSEIVIAKNREEAQGTLAESQGDTNTDGNLLLITSLLLSAATLSLIFFRGMYLKAYRALFNDNLLSQLYREREAGALGIFLITYSVFFLAAGFFTVLALRHWGYLGKEGLWPQFLYITMAITALMTIKHLLLAIIGYVFPVEKETSRYSFTIMVFAIVLGLFLTIGTVVLAYAPTEYHRWIIYICLGTLLTVYLLRSFRGLFIANRFIFNYQFHFLSYICAVEIGPALCLFKYLTDF
jgi:hypothetical protein